MRVLIVEDEVRLARHIASALTEAGDDPVVIHDGEEALRQAMDAPFDLIVLDIGLPRIDGFEVLRRLRACHVPSRVLILTARGQVTDRVSGLELGADDYLAKPFAMQELLARIRALGRESIRHARVGPCAKRRHLQLEFARKKEVVAVEVLDELSARELTLLKVLMREPGRVFTRTELCERVWEHPHEYDTKLVEVFIGRLRKKIGDPQLIHTVRHVGYAIREPDASIDKPQK